MPIKNTTKVIQTKVLHNFLGGGNYSKGLHPVLDISIKILDVQKSFNPQNPKFGSTDPSWHMGNPITPCLGWEGHSTSLLGEYIGWLPSWFEGTIFNTYLINNMIPTPEDTPILYVQYLKNTWHSPCILVYIDPLLTYLLVSEPSILTLKYLTLPILQA